MTELLTRKVAMTPAVTYIGDLCNLVPTELALGFEYSKL